MLSISKHKSFEHLWISFTHLIPIFTFFVFTVHWRPWKKKHTSRRRYLSFQHQTRSIQLRANNNWKHVSGAQPFCLTCSSYTNALLPASEWTASRIDMELYLRRQDWWGIFKYFQDSSRFEWFGMIWHDLYDLASVAPAPWLSRYFSTSSCRKVTVAELHYHSLPFRWPSTKR